jgi:hypothetical protein
MSRASSDGVISSGIALLSADSVGYLSLAASVDWLTATPWNRVLYIALLRIGQGWGDPANFIVAVQLIALVLASAIAHRLATDLAGRWAGLAATLVLAVNPLVAQWAQFVLTETLFFALIMATLWAGRRVLINAEDRRSALLLATLGLLAALLRPNGVLVLGSALTIVSLRAAGGRRVLLILLTWTVVGVGLWSGLMAAGQPAERSLTEQLHGGIVVEGADHVRTAVTMPAPRDPADVSMGAALEYVLRHPVATTRLAVSRMAVESVQIRRHYPRAVNLAVGLAVSLHAARDELRDELVPVNRRHRIAELMTACADYLAAKRRRITFEWALIDGVNDTDRDARELAGLCFRLSPAAHVNLIPLNPTPGWPTTGTPPARVAAFQRLLRDLGVNATTRKNRGTEIDAACGQLAAGQPVVLQRK